MQALFHHSSRDTRLPNCQHSARHDCQEVVNEIMEKIKVEPISQKVLGGKIKQVEEREEEKMIKEQTYQILIVCN